MPVPGELSGPRSSDAGAGARGRDWLRDDAISEAPTLRTSLRPGEETEAAGGGICRARVRVCRPCGRDCDDGAEIEFPFPFPPVTPSVMKAPDRGESWIESVYLDPLLCCVTGWSLSKESFTGNASLAASSPCREIGGGGDITTKSASIWGFILASFIMRLSTGVLGLSRLVLGESCALLSAYSCR